jgi:hypothetical protein
MSSWKRIAIQLLPEHTSGFDSFRKAHMTIYQVFFRLRDDAEEYIRSDNQEGLIKIFTFVEWCFKQRNRNPDIWNAAATAFLEHLADNDEGSAVIPIWVIPDIFKDMQPEFRKRRERDGEGKFQQLLNDYNRVNSTDFQ